MKGRVSRRHLTIALAVIAAVAIAAPAIGGSKATTSVSVSKKTLKKLIRNEVARQVAKATGPPGARGADGVNGADGADGADGTARAYARVDPFDCDDITNVCEFEDSKGVTSVVRLLNDGEYCVTAPGINAEATPAAVTVDEALTADPEGNASAMIRREISCGGPELSGFRVMTQRQPVTSGTTVGSAVPANDVGFTIVIP